VVAILSCVVCVVHCVACCVVCWFVCCAVCVVCMRSVHVCCVCGVVRMRACVLHVRAHVYALCEEICVLCELCELVCVCVLRCMHVCVGVRCAVCNTHTCKRALARVHVCECVCVCVRSRACVSVVHAHVAHTGNLEGGGRGGCAHHTFHYTAGGAWAGLLVLG
jgi:hypothetical protein